MDELHRPLWPDTPRLSPSLLEQAQTGSSRPKSALSLAARRHGNLKMEAAHPESPT